MDASSAVFPTVRIVDDALHLAYFLPDCTNSAVVSYWRVGVWEYGYPNDEGLRSHRYWGKGLKPYEFHVVAGVNVVDDLTQFIATFHDGTLEISSVGMSIRERCCVDQNPSEALNVVLGVAPNSVLDENTIE